VTWKLRHRTRNGLRVLFWDARRFWVTLIVSLAPLYAVAVWPSCREAAVLYSGVGLQLAGLGLVAAGIHQTRQRFGRPSIWQNLRKWFADLKHAVLLPPITAVGSDTAVLTGTIHGTAQLYPPTVSTTLEERIAALEKKVTQINQRLSQSIADNAKVAADLRSALAQEAAARERVERGLRLLIEDEATGGLHLEMMGLVWLLVGTIAGSIPAELAAILP
jgi:hypothetical protein